MLKVAFVHPGLRQHGGGLLGQRDSRGLPGVQPVWGPHHARVSGSPHQDGAWRASGEGKLALEGRGTRCLDLTQWSRVKKRADQ